MIAHIFVSYCFLIISNLFRGNARLVFTIISSAFVFFLLGFRSGFLTDYENYIGAISEMYQSRDFFGNGFDPFFDFTVWLTFSIGAPEYFVLTLYFFLTFFFLAKVAWSSTNYPTLSFMLLLFVAPVAASLNITRQVLAFSIVLYFFIRFFSVKLFLYELFVIVTAYLVHTSVLIMLPLRLAVFLPASFRFWLFIVFLAFLSKQFSGQLIDHIIAIYSTTDLPYSAYLVNTKYLFTDRNNSGFLQYGNICLALWVAYKLPEISVNRLNGAICKIYILGVVLTFLFMEFQAFVRLFLNFSWFLFLAIPIALHSYKDYWLKLFSAYGVIMYSVILFGMWVLRLYSEFGSGSHHFL